VPTANGCGHGGKEHGTGAPPEWQQSRGGGGEKTLTEPESSGGDDEEEDESGEEGDVTPPPHSPPPEGHPSLGDICSRQVGIFIATRRLKRPRTEIGSSTGLPP
jgi:hypothetical protein